MIDQNTQTKAKDFQIPFVRKRHPDFKLNTQAILGNSFQLNKLFYKAIALKASASESIYERRTSKERELIKIEKTVLNPVHTLLTSKLKLDTDYLLKLTCLLQSKNDPEYNLKLRHMNKTVYRLNEKNNLCVTLPKFNQSIKDDIHGQQECNAHQEGTLIKSTAKNKPDVFETPVKNKRDEIKRNMLLKASSHSKLSFKPFSPLFSKNKRQLQRKKLQLLINNSNNYKLDIITLYKPFNEYQTTNTQFRNKTYSMSHNKSNQVSSIATKTIKSEKKPIKLISIDNDPMNESLPIKHLKDRFNKLNELTHKMKSHHHSLGHKAKPR